MSAKSETVHPRLHARLALDTRDEAVAHECERALQEMGFTILQTTPRGVSFEGEATQFESVFHAQPQPLDEGYRFVGEPELPEALQHDGVSLYFPTHPTRF